MSEEYSVDGIVRNSWPEWERAADGCWRRRWSFRLQHAVEAIPDADSLSVPGLTLEIAGGTEPDELIVIAGALGNPWSDELFFVASYRLFQQLELRFGRLVTIQGEARELWRPFRIS